MKYRIRQFLWAITAKFKKIDYTLLEQYLDTSEMSLFFQLKPSEIQHSIRVCKKAMVHYNDELDKNKLAKIALLHDVGKIDNSLNTIEKSILVILDKVTNGKIKKYKTSRIVDGYYNHPYKSVKLLTDLQDYDKEFLEAIQNHHYNKYIQNDYLEIIKLCDGLS